MKFITTCASLVLLIQFQLYCQSNPFEKEDISVLPFSGWQGPNAEEMEEIITERILNLIVASKKFNVITTDDAELKEIAKELRLQLSGMVDEATAVEVGKRRGVNKFIVGNFAGNTTDYHPAYYNDEGELAQPEYYSTKIKANIRLLDIETGVYVESTEATAYAEGRNPQSASTEALGRLAYEIVDKFKKYFLIQAYIKDIREGEIILDRGYEMGVKEGMVFEVFNLNANENQNLEGDIEIHAGTPKLGLIKITETESMFAKGLVLGKSKISTTGLLVREVREEKKNEATILEKSLNKVVIDRGSNFEIKEGQYFKVIKAKKDRLNLGKNKAVGLIYIDKVEFNHAEGRVLDGRYQFKKGMLVKHTYGSPILVGGSVSYGFSHNQKTIEPNQPSGDYTIDNGEPGPRTIGTDYLAGYKPLSGGSVLHVNMQVRDLLSNFSGGIGLDFYSLGDGELKTWLPKAFVNYHIPLVPEILYLSPGIELGYGRLKQDLSVINEISDQESDYVRDWSFMAAGKLEANLRIKNVVFFGEVAYRNLRFNSWKYEAHTGKQNKEGEPEKKFYKVPDEIVPYPDVRFGPVFFTGGIRIEIPSSLN
ncbi:hypothetical protein [Flexithrix dorotheae]|uniref:hypothetical protein n=1 Tax=Flexithrix dorotheae TaxID=70993 RepID=UPI00037245F0|nr:hypothetical protein [Flexithrix dorotheae]